MLSVPMGNLSQTSAADSASNRHLPEAVAESGRLRTLTDWVLSAEREQRSYIVRFLIGGVNCLAALLALELAVYIGVVAVRDTGAMHALVISGVLVEIIFYTLLRSGLNKRFADPSQTEYQINAATAFIGVGYWIASPVGSAVPLVLLVIVMMFGMFSTTPRQLGRCCIWAMAVMAVAFVMVARTLPDPLFTKVQWFHGAMIAMVLPTIYILGSQLARIRGRLKDRKTELKIALQRIEALAMVDVLTGLLNRREMHNVLERQEKMALRQEKEFCVCMIDIDLFKNVNDAHGHNAGDEVLRVFASTAKSVLRETDVISRWGGEEFLVLMPHTSISLAKGVVDRMRAAVSEAVVVVTNSGARLNVTFSAGLAEYRPGEPIDSVIERADKALYRAKSEGRDRTVLDRSGESEAAVGTLS